MYEALSLLRSKIKNADLDWVELLPVHSLSMFINPKEVYVNSYGLVRAWKISVDDLSAETLRQRLLECITPKELELLFTHNKGTVFYGITLWVHCTQGRQTTLLKVLIG